MEHRGYNIKLNKVGPAGYSISRQGAGALPVALSGDFTTTPIARSAIDRYVDSQPKESVVLQDLPKRTTKDAIPRDK